MNKTLLLILCDFLLLNLLALTRWEKAEPAEAKQPPVPEMAANAATKDQDLVDTMKRSLEDERSTRDQLAQRLSATESELAQRGQNISQLQADRDQLATNLTQTQRTAEELGQKVASATQDAAMTKEQLDQIRRELEQKRAEAEKQAAALAALEKQQSEARERIENLNVAVKVAEQEKQLLRNTADSLKTQVEVERQERQRVQENNAQLAQGVGQLAQSSGELTKEIRDNRPINANVLFSDFLANRVETTIKLNRKGFLGQVNRDELARTVFVTNGTQVYALLHVADTPFSFMEIGSDWTTVGVNFTKASYNSPAPSFSFLTLDPRIIAIPVEPSQVDALGVKVYQTALEPFKFPEAVLINGGGKGYGEVGFKLDASQPGYVQVDNRFFKRLFGDFAPSRGDLVLSKTGELLGIMVNSDYCALVETFQPLRTIKTGTNIPDQQTGPILDYMSNRYRQLPLKLQ